ncbi:MAG: 50S ribosomal protein L5 [Chitinispirillaceae bacterium]|nr:50S ribosomal protein L5 [Chitinispirillaceae bacterium]
MPQDRQADPYRRQHSRWREAGALFQEGQGDDRVSNAKDNKDNAVKKDAPGKDLGKDRGKDRARNAGKDAEKSAPEPTVTPRLLVRYKEKVVPALMKRRGYANIMEVPRLVKIVVNMGVGAATADAKILDEAVSCLRDIAGQKPVVTRARKAISNFKLRENQAIGTKVTLRGNRMWEFFDRLVSITIPRIRDFRGLSRRSFDGQGNYTIGVKEQTVFLEIDRDKVSRVSGMDITICTTAKTSEEGLVFLEEMGMPFRKAGDKEEKEEKKRVPAEVAEKKKSADETGKTKKAAEGADK